MNPFTTRRVTLNPVSLAFARKEGQELFENRRNLRPGDTVHDKIRNSLKGAFGQQYFIDMVPGSRRVTDEECPHFAYDVICDDHEALATCAGWHDPAITSRRARVEIKTLIMESSARTWLAFGEKNIQHARTCAKSRLYDYMAIFGASNIDSMEDTSLENYSADVSFLGIISNRGIANDLYWNRSKYKENQVYINHHSINEAEVGMVLL